MAAETSHLKHLVANAALAGALAGITASLQKDYTVELVSREPLYIQVRVRPKARPGAAPRYFVVKASEPI